MTHKLATASNTSQTKDCDYQYQSIATTPYIFMSKNRQPSSWRHVHATSQLTWHKLSANYNTKNRHQKATSPVAKLQT